jgi:catechol 2,3-dioxygenase-like lactoylglutathione lyase family enzyme
VTAPKERTRKSPLAYTGGLTCALNVADLEASIRWYRDVLDFQLLYKMDDLGWCELVTEVPGVNVGLSQVEEPRVKGGAVLTFGVKDIDAARGMLEGKDVRFDGETRTITDMVKLATFYDPDGNTFMLYQDLQKG